MIYTSGSFYQGEMLLKGSLFLSSPLFSSITQHTNAQLFLASQIFDSTTKHTEAVSWSFESFVNRLDSLNIYFGINATQDSNYLYIKKSDLTGLTPSLNNKPESLLVAILLKVLSNFPVVDENGIEFDNLNLFRWQNMIIRKNDFYYVRNTIVIETFYLATLAQIELD